MATWLRHNPKNYYYYTGCTNHNRCVISDLATGEPTTRACQGILRTYTCSSLGIIRVTETNTS
jgi:hypothetical protein